MFIDLLISDYLNLIVAFIDFALAGVNMKAAVLEESNMAGVNLRVATLKNANLQNCILRGAVLAGADLEVRKDLLGIIF